MTDEMDEHSASNSPQKKNLRGENSSSLGKESFNTTPNFTDMDKTNPDNFYGLNMLAKKLIPIFVQDN